jgi:thioredoxin-like negative regulator of GroEL
MLGAAAAERSYRAALERWPGDELVLFASAGQRYAAGDLGEATTLYRRLLAAAPQNAAARNNLANVLAERGCHDEALAEARAALAEVAAADELGAAVRDTVAQLERSAAQPQGQKVRCE